MSHKERKYSIIVGWRYYFQTIKLFWLPLFISIKEVDLGPYPCLVCFIPNKKQKQDLNPRVEHSCTVCALNTVITP